DRAGAIARIGPRVPDIDFVAGLGTDLLGIGAANENAAVGIRFDPEFGPDLVILVVGFGDEESVTLVRNDHAVFDAPVGITDLAEAVEALAIEQRDPPSFARSLRRIGQGGEAENKRCNGSV